MNKSYLAMALHFHQPVGNFEDIIERAYRNCYLPLIEVISDYPDIKMAFHVSGCLLDYFEAKHPRLLDGIEKMVRRGQIEIIGGGYYEPILTSVPERDLSGQIEMMSAYIKSRFKCDPKGAWIPERVWQPGLAGLINKAGVKYCILDDTHLLRAGVAKERTYGYFMTGKENAEIAVFPSDEKLRYSIPFSGSPRQVMEYFAEVANKQEQPLFVYGDDAEKFGEWPGTHKWVFEERWLRNFFDELRKNSNWLELVHFSDYLSSNFPLGKTEIPEASYNEMMEWNGGSWSNFLVKYPEANQMHKKMFYVSRKLEDAEQLAGKGELRQARRRLYQGQCNCAYWHGVFGGLYLYHLRSAIFNNLIEADKIIDEVLHENKRRWLEIKKIDYDNDGKKEIVMESPDFALYLDPAEGGVLKELDYRPFSVNFVNALARYREQYHQILQAAKERRNDKEAVRTIHEDIKEIDPAIGDKLYYDKYPRYCLRDHFISDKISRKYFIEGSYEELGCFSEGPYEARIEGEKVILDRNNFVCGEKIKISKQVTVKSGKELQVDYFLEKENRGDLKILFGMEFNFTMPALNSERYRYYSEQGMIGGLSEEGEVTEAALFDVMDLEKELGLKFIFSGKAEKIWYFPLKTVSQSERAYELNFQGMCIFPLWKLDFRAEKKWDFKINILFKKDKRCDKI